MKSKIWILALLIIACNNKKNNIETTNADTIVSTDTIKIERTKEPQKPTPQQYSNDRFRQVTAENLGENKFRIQGQAQVFEANLSWVIEDGHNELKKGFTTTDAGAPEWGNFDFTIDIQKKDQNTTLHLILFEASAKDGSRQSELPIPLL